MPGQLFSQLHPDWQLLLAVDRLLIDQIESLLIGKDITPDFSNIFRALTTPIADIRVVIFGQDPYPTRGSAQGLAFSVTVTENRVPASLRNIFTELANDCGAAVRTNTDLSDWSSQGVLLLNRILTTQTGTSLFHTDLNWQHITDAVAAELGRRDVVAICWGRSANEVSRFFRTEWVVSSVHPSPLSAYRGFFGSKPFSKANAILTENGDQPINWG